MKVTTSHTFPVSARTFWYDIYFNKEYNEKLYVERIHAKSYELLEFTDTDTEIRRMARVVPEQKAPSVIKKLMRDEFSYTEKGTFKKKEEIYRFTIIPSVKPEKISVSGFVSLKPEGSNITRTIDLDLKADIFAIGGQIEKFVGDQIKKGYDESYSFTLTWIRDRGLK
jgi:hypothetical protein